MIFPSTVISSAAITQFFDSHICMQRTFSNHLVTYLAFDDLQWLSLKTVYIIREHVYFVNLPQESHHLMLHSLSNKHEHVNLAKANVLGLLIPDQ